MHPHPVIPRIRDTFCSHSKHTTKSENLKAKFISLKKTRKIYKLYSQKSVILLNRRLNSSKNEAIENHRLFRYDNDNSAEIKQRRIMMEIGNQIKQLRLRKGITQEALAQHLGVTAQAVSKWERNAATPDIGMLPEISAYFGITIDELFALSDETRMERIQNMLWDVRFLNPADVENERQFLLEKAKREPENGRPHELLADMENHLAGNHLELASQYAMESLRRDSSMRYAHGELISSMKGKIHDWNGSNHHRLIDFYMSYIAEHPDCKNAYLSIMDQLIDDYRIAEARMYCDRYAALDNSYRVPLYRGMIEWQDGNREAAFAIWAQMEKDFPNDWCVYHNIADYLVRSGRANEAYTYYRKALDIQKAPRYVDPIEALAQLYEMQGDYAGSIAAWKEELELFDKEWNFTTGETADVVRRQIARLEKKL